MDAIGLIAQIKSQNLIPKNVYSENGATENPLFTQMIKIIETAKRTIPEL